MASRVNHHQLDKENADPQKRAAGNPRKKRMDEEAPQDLADKAQRCTSIARQLDARGNQVIDAAAKLAGKDKKSETNDKSLFGLIVNRLYLNTEKESKVRALITRILSCGITLSALLTVE